MAHTVRETRVIHRDDGRDYYEDDVDHTTNVAARIINTIGSVIIGLLLIRFVLVLLGANSANALVNFIYTLTTPFVAPFFGIFNYTAKYGIVHFEFETLIAIAAYALLTWLLMRLVTVGNRHAEV